VAGPIVLVVFLYSGVGRFSFGDEFRSSQVFLMASAALFLIPVAVITALSYKEGARVAHHVDRRRWLIDDVFACLVWSITCFSALNYGVERA